ncbi:hypothetical protein P4T89_03230 [Bacillus nakamurai]|uniref:Uncharacterized protein n=1 Tax=Bacillus nakamurai TaxID=1793963 RepID=A0A150F996_9BACI|nr:hypothetical protein [Bacillus nakamurai]KXZ21766.1 hypothetical protein AXI58_12545 [Bacillus nakamurai]MED1226644.1 hypothetical protein [Bacillus nakamurai]
MKKVLKNVTSALLVLGVVFSFGFGEKASAANEAEKQIQTKTAAYGDAHALAGTNWFYDTDGSGYYFTMQSGESNPDLGSWKNKISTITVAPRSYVKLFWSTYYSGSSYTFNNYTNEYQSYNLQNFNFYP